MCLIFETCQKIALSFETSYQIVLLFWETPNLDSAKTTEIRKNDGIAVEEGSAIPYPPYIAYLLLLTKRETNSGLCLPLQD